MTEMYPLVITGAVVIVVRPVRVEAVPRVGSYPCEKRNLPLHIGGLGLVSGSLVKEKSVPFCQLLFVFDF